MPRAPLGPTVALTVTVGLACFAALAAVVLALVEPVPIPGLEQLSQRQDAETALYALAFAVIVPGAAIFVPRVADAVAAGTGAAGLSLLAAVLAAALIVVVILARVLPGNGELALLVGVGLWSAGATAALRRATRPARWPPLAQAERLAGPAWIATAALLVASALAFTALDSISAVALAAGVAAVACCAIAYRRGAFGRLPRPSRGWGLAIDVGAVVGLALVVPDLVVFEPADAAHPLAEFMARVMQFHQDFLVGPANQVLAGDAVLVDTGSQYGVAPIYLLAAWDQLVPIGYGTTGLLDGLLYVAAFAAAYAILRLARVPRTLTIGAMGIAVVVLLYNLVFPVGGLLQHGALRFGLPLAVVLAATAAARRPGWGSWMLAAQLAALGLSAIWALEAFAYTAFTFVALAVLAAWSEPAPGRLRRLGVRLALGAAACLAAHLLLALATLAFAGELPDWGRYFAYLDALVFGELADLTYDYTSWSPGLPVGVGLAASAIGVVLVVARRPALLEREPAAITALAGVTAYGIALYTYFVNRSSDDILPYVSLPALVAAAIWLSLLLRGSLEAPRAARVGGLAAALGLALILVSVAWSSISDRFSNTPLALAAPGGESLGGALDRLWELPPINPATPEGEALLERHFGDRQRVPVIVAPDLGLEILTRTGRAHSLPFSHPVEDFFAGLPSDDEIDAAVAALQPGDRVLVDETALSALAQLRRDPGRDVLADPPVTQPEALTPQQQLLILRIAERYRLRVLERSPQGLVVVRLEERR